MPYRKFPPPVASIQPKRVGRRDRHVSAHRCGVVSLIRALVTGVVLSIALSGCGVFCNIGGGSGGIGGSCGVGTGFRF